MEVSEINRLTLAMHYPQLQFSENALVQIDNLSTLLQNEDLLSPENKAGIIQELQERLKYLNGYGGDNWRVHLYADPGTKYSFELLWKRKNASPAYGAEEWLPVFNGGLQFNLAPGAFASVVIGTPSYWSVNT